MYSFDVVLFLKKTKKTREFFVIDKSLMEQCRVEIEGPLILNFYLQRRNNNAIKFLRCIIAIAV